MRNRLLGRQREAEAAKALRRENLANWGAEIPLEYVRQRISYNPITGELTWLANECAPAHWNTKFAGKIAGSAHNAGYTKVCILGVRLLAHRLAWLLHYGEWPHREVDHRNLVKTDNRICNLRLATRAENGRNTPVRRTNIIGVKGVSQSTSGRFTASITIGGKRIHLGSFDDVETASAVYTRAAIQAFGDFARPSVTPREEVV